MRELVRELEKQADLVIVDSVAALAVSDALPLLQEVSGSVVVVRMDRTSRAGVRRLQKMIVSAQGTVLGAVATGTGTLASAYGGYVYGYDATRAVCADCCRGHGPRLPITLAHQTELSPPEKRARSRRKLG